MQRDSQQEAQPEPTIADDRAGVSTVVAAPPDPSEMPLPIHSPINRAWQPVSPPIGRS